MYGLIRYLFGWARVRVTGASPETLLNRLTEAEIPLWMPEWEDALHLRLCVPLGRTGAVRELALRCFCDAEVTERHGLPLQLRAALRRPFLSIGALLAVAALFFLQNFVWVIRVEGTQTLHPQQVVRALEELDISFGSWAPAIDSQMTKNRMLNLLPQLSWLAVNRSGGRLNVLLTERRQETEKRESYSVANIVALRDGVLTEVSVFEGMQLCKRGDAVREGQVLVSGFEDNGLFLRAVCAQGEIYAETRHTGTVVMPATAWVKCYTGRQRTQVTLVVGRKRINLCGNSSIFMGSCDKMVEEKQLTLPRGETLPLRLEIATYAEYTLERETLPEKTARQSLTAAWLRSTEHAMIAGTVDSTESTLLCDGEVYILQAQSACTEMIGRQVPMDTVYEGETNERTDH